MNIKDQYISEASRIQKEAEKIKESLDAVKLKIEQAEKKEPLLNALVETIVKRLKLRKQSIFHGQTASSVGMTVDDEKHEYLLSVVIDHDNAEKQTTENDDWDSLPICRVTLYKSEKRKIPNFDSGFDRGRRDSYVVAEKHISIQQLIDKLASFTINEEVQIDISDEDNEVPGRYITLRAKNNPSDTFIQRLVQSRTLEIQAFDSADRILMEKKKVVNVSVLKFNPFTKERTWVQVPFPPEE